MRLRTCWSGVDSVVVLSHHQRTVSNSQALMDYGWVQFTFGARNDRGDIDIVGISFFVSLVTTVVSVMTEAGLLIMLTKSKYAARYSDHATDSKEANESD